MIGVEIVEEAVEAARENAARNGLSNCKFIADDVFKALDEIEEKPDVIVLDPPRDGIHPKALPKILDYGVDHIVYISCKEMCIRDSYKISGLYFGSKFRIQRFKCILFHLIDGRKQKILRCNDLVCVHILSLIHI